MWSAICFEVLPLTWLLDAGNPTRCLKNPEQEIVMVFVHVDVGHHSTLCNATSKSTRQYNGTTAISPENCYLLSTHTKKSIIIPGQILQGMTNQNLLLKMQKIKGVQLLVSHWLATVQGIMANCFSYSLPYGNPRVVTTKAK